MSNPVVHFEIVGKDRKALEAFYQSIFEWKITPAMETSPASSTPTATSSG